MREEREGDERREDLLGIWPNKAALQRKMAGAVGRRTNAIIVPSFCSWVSYVYEVRGMRLKARSERV